MRCSYHYGLCTSEKEFHQVLRKMEMPPKEWPAWIGSPQSSGTCHFLEHSNGNRAAVVCINVDEGRSAVEIAGLLVHEAVHIWQAHRDDIGERTPASEEEAYAIQCIAQNLMSAYAEKVKQ